MIVFIELAYVIDYFVYSLNKIKWDKKENYQKKNLSKAVFHRTDVERTIF